MFLIVIGLVSFIVVALAGKPSRAKPFKPYRGPYYPYPDKRAKGKRQ